jgi:hypothetical protein
MLPCAGGAFAGGQTIADVGSGIGFGNNTQFLADVQKTVVR